MLNTPNEGSGLDESAVVSTSDRKVFISWAHRNVDWNDEQEQQWTGQAHAFAELLIRNGFPNTEIDLWYLDSPVPVWTRWGPQQIEDADFVVVLLSNAWKERWEGTNDPTVGAGAAGEANTLRGIFQRNQQEFQRKVVLVALPPIDGLSGVGDSALPDELRGVSRKNVKQLTVSGIGELVRLFTGQPRYTKPTAGPVPVLPPIEAPALSTATRPVPGLAEEPSATAPTSGPVNVSGSGNTVMIGNNHVHQPTMSQSTYELIGRTSYLAGSMSASTSRRRRLRFGAGLDEQQVERSLLNAVAVPSRIDETGPGEIRVLTGPLGSGKSEIAEEWLRASIRRAQNDDSAPVPLFISAKELDETVDVRVSRDIGSATVLRCGVDIVIDGLDERTDLAATKVQEASEFVARWTKSRVVLTTRNPDLRDESVQVAMSDMTDAQAAELMSAVAGRPIPPLGAQLTKSVRRPLFAVLTASHATANDGVTGTSELIDRVVEQIVESEGMELIPYLMELAIETVSTGKAVDPTRFASLEIASKIRKSPLVTGAGKTCAFSLATFEQWFAAQAILDGKVDVVPLLSSMRSFDRWKYVFSILLAAGEPTKVDLVMADIARWNPGAAAWIIKETERGGLTRHISELEESDWESAGHRIRYAQAAWLAGLGPLGQAFFSSFAGVASGLDDIALSVRIGRSKIAVSWIAPRDGETGSLPEIIKAGHDFEYRVMVMRQHALPTGVNWVWALTQSYLRDDISSSFKNLILGTATEPGIVRDELTSGSPETIGTWGSTMITPQLYPGPDISPSQEDPWGNFTARRMHERVCAIATAALQCYHELVERLVPNFTGTLGTQGLFPVEFFGDVNFTPGEDQGAFSFGPPEAGLGWTLRARASSPFDEATALSNTVNLTLNDEKRSAEMSDDRDVQYAQFQAYMAQSPEFAEFAPSFSTVSQRVSPTESTPATGLASGLLWGDLEKLNWVSGQRPLL